MMSNRSFLILSILTLTSWCSLGVAAEPRPNIVVILGMISGTVTLRARLCRKTRTAAELSEVGFPCD